MSIETPGDNEEWIIPGLDLDASEPLKLAHSVQDRLILEDDPLSKEQIGKICVRILNFLWEHHDQDITVGDRLLGPPHEEGGYDDYDLYKLASGTSYGFGLQWPNLISGPIFT